MDCTQLIESDTERSQPSVNKVVYLEVGTKTYQLLQGKEYTIGRHEECDIFIDNQTMSSNHASLHVDEENTIELMDLRSSNRTFLNNRVLKPNLRYFVEEGSQIRFGTVRARIILRTQDLNESPNRPEDLEELPDITSGQRRNAASTPSNTGTILALETPDIRPRKGLSFGEIEESCIVNESPTRACEGLANSSVDDLFMAPTQPFLMINPREDNGRLDILQEDEDVCCAPTQPFFLAKDSGSENDDEISLAATQPFIKPENLDELATQQFISSEDNDSIDFAATQPFVTESPPKTVRSNSSSEVQPLNISSEASQRRFVESSFQVVPSSDETTNSVLRRPTEKQSRSSLSPSKSSSSILENTVGKVDEDTGPASVQPFWSQQEKQDKIGAKISLKRLSRPSSLLETSRSPPCEDQLIQAVNMVENLRFNVVNNEETVARSLSKSLKNTKTQELVSLNSSDSIYNAETQPISSLQNISSYRSLSCNSEPKKDEENLSEHIGDSELIRAADTAEALVFNRSFNAQASTSKAHGIGELVSQPLKSSTAQSSFVETEPVEKSKMSCNSDNNLMTTNRTESSRLISICDVQSDSVETTEKNADCNSDEEDSVVFGLGEFSPSIRPVKGNDNSHNSDDEGSLVFQVNDCSPCASPVSDIIKDEFANSPRPISPILSRIDVDSPDVSSGTPDLSEQTNNTRNLNELRSDGSPAKDKRKIGDEFSYRDGDSNDLFAPIIKKTVHSCSKAREILTKPGSNNHIDILNQYVETSKENQIYLVHEEAPNRSPVGDAENISESSYNSVVPETQEVSQVVPLYRLANESVEEASKISPPIPLTQLRKNNSFSKALINSEDTALDTSLTVTQRMERIFQSPVKVKHRKRTSDCSLEHQNTEEEVGFGLTQKLDKMFGTRNHETPASHNETKERPIKLFKSLPQVQTSGNTTIQEPVMASDEHIPLTQIFHRMFNSPPREIDSSVSAGGGTSGNIEKSAITRQMDQTLHSCDDIPSDLNEMFRISPKVSHENTTQELKGGKINISSPCIKSDIEGVSMTKPTKSIDNGDKLKDERKQKNIVSQNQRGNLTDGCNQVAEYPAEPKRNKRRTDIKNTDKLSASDRYTRKKGKISNDYDINAEKGEEPPTRRSARKQTTYKASTATSSPRELQEKRRGVSERNDAVESQPIGLRKARRTFQVVESGSESSRDSAKVESVEVGSLPGQVFPFNEEKGEGPRTRRSARKQAKYKVCTPVSSPHELQDKRLDASVTDNATESLPIGLRNGRRTFLVVESGNESSRDSMEVECAETGLQTGQGTSLICGSENNSEQPNADASISIDEVDTLQPTNTNRRTSRRSKKVEDPVENSSVGKGGVKKRLTLGVLPGKKRIKVTESGSEPSLSVSSLESTSDIKIPTRNSLATSSKSFGVLDRVSAEKANMFTPSDDTGGLGVIRNNKSHGSKSLDRLDSDILFASSAGSSQTIAQRKLGRPKSQQTSVEILRSGNRRSAKKQRKEGGKLLLDQSATSTEQPLEKRGRRRQQELSVAARSSVSSQESSLLDGSPRRVSAQKFKVAFTGYSYEEDVKAVVDLGGQVIESGSDCTVLVTPHIRRTCKLLCTIARGKPIVNTLWIKESKRSKTLLDLNSFILEDKEMEEKFGFNLKRTLNAAARSPLLTGQTVFVTPSVKPDPSQMKEIIECAGGNYSEFQRLPRSASPSSTWVISCPEDRHLWPTARRLCIKVVAVEALLSGLLKHKIHLDPFLLE
ncbi:uncharacterized protein LOC136033805 [Artemia franciscana]|uniref:Mediator of DNA damage checkpoint protein 1 n=1 Tax=Artemia franciscana TaxID=6661 RepID=A0AA88LAL3_ARTSF|nr:hypothetical protein QYM36_001877 [Artemia franciscana]